MKTTARHRFTVDDVLLHMQPGVAHSIVDLARVTGYSRHTLNLVLDQGTYSRKIETRIVGPKKLVSFYVFGTAPQRERRPTLEGEALPITIRAATAVGTIDAYAQQLTSLMQLAMLTRKPLDNA